MTEPTKRDASLTSTPAIISFIVMAMFAATLAGTFWLARVGAKIDPAALSILNMVIGVLIAGFSGVVGYWTGSSAGSKTANAALAQLAGAGPPPPADPLNPTNPLPQQEGTQ